jgi:Zn-dependent protease
MNVSQDPREIFPSNPPSSPLPPRPPVLPHQTPARGGEAIAGRGSIRLFRIWGITVFLHWSWFLVAIYQIRERRHEYSSIPWNIAEYVALFGIVLLHEFGHALACRSVGGRANKITLWPLGGVAYVSPPPRPGAMLWSIAAGPLVNVVLVPVTYVLKEAYGHAGVDIARLTYEIFVINLGLLIFNMLPIYPLDGGQILYSLLWFVMGRGKSLMVAASVGILGAACLGLLALFLQNGWIGVLAIFAAFVAFRGIQTARLLLARERSPRRPDARCPACRKNPTIGPFWNCPRCANMFDTFTYGGMCPRCGTAFQQIQCLDCGKNNPISVWMLAAMVVAFVESPQFPPGSVPQTWINSRNL